MLSLLRPELAQRLLAYKRRNVAHLAPWEPARNLNEGSLEESCERVARKSLQGFEAGTSVQFVALDRASQTMVAGCNFTNIVRGPLQACHLGYSVDQAWQGHGLMREVVLAGIDYMFGVMSMHRIMANHMPSNLRSEKLLHSLGFQREGYAPAYLYIAGKWEDMVLNALVNPRG